MDTKEDDMRRKAWAATVAAAVGLAVLGGSPASAVQPVSQEVVTNPDPVNWTPHVLDGDVRAIEEVGDTTLVGGDFHSVRNAGDDLTTLTRDYLFAYDGDTGTISTTFTPSLNGMVYDIEPSGDGQTAYVAGQFSSVAGGSGRTSRIARLDVTTGAIDPTFRSPGFNGLIKSVVLRGGRLYVGGSFTVAGPSTRTILAELDPTTGALLDTVNLDFNTPRNGGNLQIMTLDVTPDGSRMMVIGNFTKIGTLDRYQIAQIDLTVSPVVVTDWQTTRYGNACSGSFDTYMRDLDISPDGSYFVAVTTGAYSGGPGAGVLCDSAARWNLGTGGPGQQPVWVDYTGGDTLWSVGVSGAAVYVGGHQRWLNNPSASDRAGQGAVAREGIAALDPRNGLPLSWNPGRERGVGAFEITAASQGVYVGSDTERFGNDEFHGRIALTPLAGGSVLPDDFTGTLPADVYSLGQSNGNTVTRRSFTGTSVTGSSTINDGTTWGNIRGAFMVDGVVYTGRFVSNFTTGVFEARTVSGSTFGAPTTVDVNGLTNFTNELRTVTGMFFDGATGRLYFTLSGSGRLYYRYFTPQSRVVGGLRFDGPANLPDLDWTRVSSMFLTGGNLYVASSLDGNLRRYAWNSAAGTPVAGATVVSGPAYGQDWRARGAFVNAPLNGGNLPPVASFTSDCSGLQCTVDASGSTDSDGTVASVAWTFGDGGTASTTTAAHLYAAAGTYDVTLTVTDDDGATNSTTQQVTVTAPASQIAFRSGVSTDANTNLVSVTLPSSVQEGDTLLMFATLNSSTVTVGTPTGVTGWTQVQALPGNTMQSVLWRRTATATDAGATVRVPLSGTAKVSLQVLAYSGSTAANPVSAAAGAAETVTTASHTTPQVSVATAGSYVVSYWADKTTDTTAWTLPGAVAVRQSTTGTGSGHIASVSGDPGVSFGVGTAGGITATANSANNKALMWSVVIAP
jgi:PKD repeat protein